MATQVVRQSSSICSLMLSFGCFPASRSASSLYLLHQLPLRDPASHKFRCREFSTSRRYCAIPLPYTRYDPPRSEKPPVVEHPVIILHGLFGSKMNWQSIAKSLKDKLRQSIICVDARNHGESKHDPDNSYEAMSEDVEELMHKLKLQKSILIGHSMGGKVAMCIALRKSAEVDSLIVVDTSPSLSPGMESFRRYITAMKALDTSRDERLPQLRGRAIKEFEEDIPELMIRQYFLTNLIEKDGKNQWRVNMDGIEKNLDNIMEFPLFHNFYGGPVLFIAGGNSNYITDEEMPEIKRLFPQVVVERIPDSGHWVHSDKPRETVDCIVKFLKNKEH